MKVHDLVGKKFGFLTILERAKNNGRYVQWLCRCDCGIEKIIRGDDFKYNKTVSCGCHKFDKRYTGLGAFHAVFFSYRNGAKNRGYSFDLTEEQCKKLFQQNCFYCGRSPTTTRKRKASSYTYNGIDRVDNTKGYTLENCVTCCKTCNKAKADSTTDEFIRWICDIANYNIKRMVQE